MKKIITILIACTLLSLLAGCGSTSKEPGTEPATTKASETDTSKDESTTATTEPETTKPEKKVIHIDTDLSLFGELVNKFFVITNDYSLMAPDKELFDYLCENGYVFYEYMDSDVDDTISPEEAYERFDKWGLNTFSDSLLQYCEKSMSSRMYICTSEGHIDTIQYKFRKCHEDQLASYREQVDKLVEDWKNQGYEMDILYSRDEETGLWTYMVIKFKGTPSNPDSSSDFFAKIDIRLNYYDSFFSFMLY
ncbi:MAG: lipoprotein [Butyrivibrio sp.]